MERRVECAAEPTAENTRCSAQGDDALAGQAVVSVAHDADEQARNLIGWRQTYDQLAAGRFVGTLTELPLDTMKLFRESTSHLLRQACEVRGDAYWFGIPLANDGNARVDACRIGPGALAFRPGNVEFELLTPAQFSIYGVVVRGDVLRRYAEEVEHRALDERLFAQRVIQVGDARLARLCALLGQRLDGAAAAGGPLADAQRDDLQAGVLAALFDACAQPADDGVGSAPSTRRWIVEQAREYVLAHRTRPVGVPELCEQLHVSRRTLQYCFQDVLGMAPATYLRTLRLNGARRDLCGRAAGSVQDVAAAWGFWHLSQFATDYRRMFGKRPSETLRDRAAMVTAG
ncbi:helix-turn-helix domain-containing protein [Burkholderia vietnamiensis]|jgi:AraC family ethanolamine operon transcriptional activator|uniref:Helix-turn-helix domain-containing protein n=1 Tax=Burkholderia vietnamiensis TaxID=60552 RepID=A0AAP1CN82_BURVI|nr:MULTISPECIES: helix-turn-helix domain-containing protein [Burkholderia]AJY05486.1 helix-turn-helix domain protein [Burkholderia vietnamiensis LMG 10929]AOJ97278.1 AraC family transcriptional regulator [Burkholderia vietnamiensis]AOK08864.1 AraC family transcriptional regulator [Burkholderia vietnamiensis]AVR15936.1 AraC family transcriptional regulator [Burkholderia vietnamiensis]KVE11844.1 AraC family transcriptional regulator [Burkholderia vietnamiensis]